MDHLYRDAVWSMVAAATAAVAAVVRAAVVVLLVSPGPQLAAPPTIS